MEINDVTAAVVDAAYQIHTEIGPGLFESVYELVLADMLASRGLPVQRQFPIPIRIGDKVYDEGFRADLIVDHRVIVEIKSVEQLAPVHKKQVLTYLKLSGLPVGLLIILAVICSRETSNASSFRALLISKPDPLDLFDPLPSSARTSKNPVNPVNPV